MYRRYRHAVTFLVGIGFSCLLALVPISASLAISPADVPNPRQLNGTWVTDMADLLSSESENQLNQMISELEAKNGVEIAVVTVEDTSPSTSTKVFATELFNQWGIGKANENNGVLFLVSKGDRRTELEIGYGLESTITNRQATQLLRDEVTPRFKEEDFDGGILQGTETLVAILGGEQTAPVIRVKRDNKWVKPFLMLSGLFGFAIVSNLLFPNSRNGNSYHNNHSYNNHSYNNHSYNNHSYNNHSSSSSSGSSSSGSDFGGGGSDGGGGGDSW